MTVGNGGIVTVINNTGSTMVVDITNASGPQATAYTDDTFSATHTLPKTITATTSFWVREGTYDVSVKVGGVEVASTPDGVRRVILSNWQQIVFAPSLDDARVADQSGTYVPNTIVGKQALETQRETALRTFRAAFANRHYSPCNVAVIGGSTSEGLGVTAYGRGWFEMLRDQIRSRYPVAGVVGGENYFSAWNSLTTGSLLPTPVVQSGSPGNANNIGWGLKAANLTGSGKTETLTFTGTAFEVWYTKAVGFGTFSVKVDGGAPVNVDTNAATDRAARYSITGLANTSHTVIVTWVSGANMYVHGFATFNGDETKGVRFFNGAQGGKTSGDFSSTAVQWQASLPSMNPHLIVLQLGINDYLSSIASATFKTNLQTIITAIRANATTNPSIVLFSGPDIDPGTFAEPWSNYRTKMQEIADADTGICVFDLAARQQSPKVSNTLALYNGDLLHPTDKGHSQIADMMLGFLAPV